MTELVAADHTEPCRAQYFDDDCRVGGRVRRRRVELEPAADDGDIRVACKPVASTLTRSASL